MTTEFWRGFLLGYFVVGCTFAYALTKAGLWQTFIEWLRKGEMTE